MFLQHYANTYRNNCLFVAPAYGNATCACRRFKLQTKRVVCDRLEQTTTSYQDFREKLLAENVPVYKKCLKEVKTKVLLETMAIHSSNGKNLVVCLS